MIHVIEIETPSFPPSCTLISLTLSHFRRMNHQYAQNPHRNQKSQLTLPLSLPQPVLPLTSLFPIRPPSSAPSNTTETGKCIRCILPHISIPIHLIKLIRNPPKHRIILALCHPVKGEGTQDREAHDGRYISDCGFHLSSLLDLDRKPDLWNVELRKEKNEGKS